MPTRFFGTKNEGFEGARRVLKHAGQRGGHEGFAETDDIAKDDTAALFQMPGRDANGGGLEFEQGVRACPAGW